MNKQLKRKTFGGFAAIAAILIALAGCGNVLEPDENTTKNNTDKSIVTEDGAAEDGAAEDGAAEDGATEDGATKDGAAEDGATKDGATKDGTAGNGGPIVSFSIAGTAVETGGSGEITVYVPYFAGFNPAALEVSVQLAKDAALVSGNLNDVPQDFSKPRTSQARTAAGTVSSFTVTVYALFSGEESLPGLAEYTDYTSGTAPMPDQNKPFYIALEDIPLSGATVPVIEPISNWGTDYPPGTSPLIRLFGAEETSYHDKIPGYTHGQYIALDLSRCADSTTLQGALLPLGNHSSASGSSYFADGPFARVTSIVFPPNLVALGEGLFQGNETLTTIKLPEGLSKIDYACFAGAKKLAAVTLPSTLKTIGNYAFMETALESLDLPQGLNRIGRGAFSGTKITRVTLPASVTEAQDSFSSIPSLVYADFSRASIDELSPISGGFTDCGLKEVYLPETLLRLGIFSLSFRGAKLEKMVIYAPVPPTLPEEYSTSYADLGEPRGPYFTSSGFKIYVPDASVELYKNAKGASAGWAQYADKIYPLSAL
jgi:hypothetical protein